MDKPAKSEYRRWIGGVLGRSPMQAMSAEGFQKRGINFSRLVGGVKQVVRFDLVIRPSYARDSAQLVLNVDLSVPSADSLYSDSMHDTPGARIPYFIRISGDSLKGPAGDLWLFADERQAESLEVPVSETLAGDVLPYLSARSSVAGLAEMCESEIYSGVRAHGALLTDRAVYVAALLSVLGRDDRAREVLGRAYPEGSRGRISFDRAVEFYSGRS